VLAAGALGAGVDLAWVVHPRGLCGGEALHRISQLWRRGALGRLIIQAFPCLLHVSMLSRAICYSVRGLSCPFVNVAEDTLLISAASKDFDVDCQLLSIWATLEVRLVCTGHCYNAIPLPGIPSCSIIICISSADFALTINCSKQPMGDVSILSSTLSNKHRYLSRHRLFQSERMN
jgi:hypothetical protein